MSEIKNSLKNALPGPVVGALRDTRDALVRASQWPSAAFHPWRRDSVRRLKALRDQHKGQRCFVIGNGPSLRNTDMSLLKNEFTIGVNRIYLAWPEWGFTTKYYVAINDLVVEQCAPDIQKLPIPKFVSWRHRQWLTPQDDLYYLFTTYTGMRFSKDITGRVWEGATVTNMALQVAFYLGFQKVILIGVDHSYMQSGKPNTTVVSQGDDPNHFNPGYFGKGFRWQLADLDTSEIGYRMARLAYETEGRKVVDATVGGKLRIFERVDYDSLF